MFVSPGVRFKRGESKVSWFGEILYSFKTHVPLKMVRKQIFLNFTDSI